MIVFLGNVGPRYNGTRHNVGFAVGDILAKRCGVSINRLRSRALTARANIGGHDVLLVKPQTFMNLSGEANGELTALVSGNGTEVRLIRRIPAVVKITHTEMLLSL